jgi:predicted metal-dependent enzyme (double-stranded beta helix superfamily)
MFDRDSFIEECRAASVGSDPRRAIKEVLERAVSEPASVIDALQPAEGGFSLLYGAPDLTLLHVVWAPRMRIYPHDHRMWAAIGIYAGQEDNEFFRRTGPQPTTLIPSGGKELAAGDVAVLGDDTVHAVTNPKDRLTGAIHVYGGDFVHQPRSQWGPGAVEERPYDIDQALEQFTAANKEWPDARV